MANVMEMEPKKLTNLSIAQSVQPRPIGAVAADLGLQDEEIEPYGRLKAKIRLEALERRAETPDGHLVLVTAVSPTKAGEGKTTTTVGLAQALWKLGVRSVAALREPSLGPVLGIKGGGTGGGYSQLVPMEEINLHFTGDIHAMSAANNLLAAVLDNHLHFDNPLEIEPRTVRWKRCMDMNDRSLRDIVTGLGGKTEGVPRETGFEITAASEVMAILSLAYSMDDLKERLARIVVGTNRRGEIITAGQLGAAGAMTVLLKDALMPNLAQTMEGTPAIVHGGPFGNIAHGCSSILGTRLALKLGEVVVTEAGFGADLGAEKFLSIKARQANLSPSLCVLAATVRALKLHGGVSHDDLGSENLTAIRAGFANLERHAENMRKFGLKVVAAINRFPTDTQAELELVRELCEAQGLPVAVADPWARGGDGTLDLGRLVMASIDQPRPVQPIYPEDASLREKIEILTREIYHAGSVSYQPAAVKGINYLESQGFGRLPICVAKTQYSFSDNPTLSGAPSGHPFTVRDVKLSAGAGFVVVYAGTIMTMPGLPRRPASEYFDLLPDGTIEGVF
jgi:formate--tetrahydrofolate ligase